MERIPQHSEAAEKGTIGSILLDATACIPECDEVGITGESFYFPAHRVIYLCCCWLLNKGRPVDTITVSEKLSGTNQLDMIGGSVYLEELIDATPTSAHIGMYAKVVMDKWNMRRADAAHREMQELAAAGHVEPDEAMASYIQKLVDMNRPRVEVVDDNRRVWEEVKKAFRDAQNGAVPGVPTPWPMVNKGLGGAPFGLVTLMAGRSKTRKSYIVHQWGLHAAVESSNPMPGAYFPLEDGLKTGMSRAVCLLADVDALKYRLGKVSKEDEEKVDEAARRLLSSPYMLVNGRGMPFSKMRLEIAKGVAKHGWRFVIIDAFKDLPRAGSEGEGEEALSQGLCDMADKHGIAVIVVHHVRKKLGDDRSAEDKENQYISQEDIRGRTKITDDARMINILQCKRQRNKFDNGIEYVDYMFDCVAINNGFPAAICLDVDQHTGRFVENTARRVWGSRD